MSSPTSARRLYARRDILFLPAEVMPREVISLLGMGGPSFPMTHHSNHLEIGV